MSEFVEIDLDLLRARMMRQPVTEEQIDLLFALLEESRIGLHAEIARLQADAAGLREQLAQAHAATEAERAARMRAEAALYERDHGEPPF